MDKIVNFSNVIASSVLQEATNKIHHIISKKHKLEQSGAPFCRAERQSLILPDHPSRKWIGEGDLQFHTGSNNGIMEAKLWSETYTLASQMSAEIIKCSYNEVEKVISHNNRKCVQSATKPISLEYVDPAGGVICEKYDGYACLLAEDIFRNAVEQIKSVTFEFSETELSSSQFECKTDKKVKKPIIDTDILCKEISQYAEDMVIAVMEDVMEEFTFSLRGVASKQDVTGICSTDLLCRDGYLILHDSYSTSGNMALDVTGHEINVCETFLYSLFLADHTVSGNNNGNNKQNKKQNRRLSKKERQRKKLLRKLPPVEPPRTYAEMGFWTKSEVTSDAQDSFACPVCFEILYNPHMCIPCEHVFCEPCLRRLAKYNADRRMPHYCPICRLTISHCKINQELHDQVISFLPEEYQQRQKVIKSNRYMKHPLPSKPSTVSLKNLVNIISERQRNRQTNRFRFAFGGIDFWRLFIVMSLFFFAKGIVILGIVWFFNLFSQDGLATKILGYVWENLYNYNSLDENKQAEVTNHIILALTVLMVITAVCYIIEKSIMNKRR